MGRSRRNRDTAWFITCHSPSTITSRSKSILEQESTRDSPSSITSIFHSQSKLELDNDSQTKMKSSGYLGYWNMVLPENDSYWV